MTPQSRSLLLATLLLTTCHGNGAPSIRHTVDASGRSVFVATLTAHLPPGLSQAALDDVLRLFVADSTETEPADLPAIAGSVTRDGDTIRFRPRFALEAGLRYRAELRAPGTRRQVRHFALPPRAPTPPPQVTHVHPSASELPENLLKFYVHFSAPMRQGEAYRWIHLLEADGSEVELPFVEFRAELWNPEGTRLTVLIDPGRIKREVQPLEEVGPVLRAGREYTLLVERDWRDAEGTSLASAYRKRFRARTADRQSPTPTSWRVTVPPGGSRQPLRVTFAEPLDSALLATRLWPVEGSGQTLAGTITVGPEERSWTFEPTLPWVRGRHELVVSPHLEDLAGNSVGRTFEVALGTADRERQESLVRVPFEVE